MPTAWSEKDERKSVRELRNRASEFNIAGRSKMKRDGLISAIRKRA